MTDAELKRLRELALRCAHTGDTCFTRFLDPAMLDAARAAAGQCGVDFSAFGGYPDAERMMAAYFDDAPLGPRDWPMTALRITWNARFAHPEHRDLLGAAMGLGVERDALGDIAPGVWRDSPCAYLFVTDEMAGYVAANLDSAGRAAVKAEPAKESPETLPPEGARLRVTVQQARLDAVLAAGFRLSRSEAQKLVAAGLVKLNHAPNLHADARVQAGDILSARGCGRLKVLDMPGESRRGPADPDPVQVRPVTDRQ